MIEPDTIKLLRECDAGIKMGIASIDEVMDYVQDEIFRKYLADLMSDGCNMGVKSLHKYLNQYKAADEKTKDIAKRLINLEEKLAIDIRQFL